MQTSDFEIESLFLQLLRGVALLALAWVAGFVAPTARGWIHDKILALMAVRGSPRDFSMTQGGFTEWMAVCALVRRSLVHRAVSQEWHAVERRHRGDGK